MGLGTAVSDAVWQVRHRHGRLHVPGLLEFRSRDEPRMAFAHPHLRESSVPGAGAQREAPGPDGPLSAVLYNGAAPWTAAVEVRDLIGPVGHGLHRISPRLATSCLDERHVGDEALPAGNLMTVVAGLPA